MNNSDATKMGFMDMFKKKEPKDLVREWQSKLRSEMRGVDRQIRGERMKYEKKEKKKRHVPAVASDTHMKKNQNVDYTSPPQTTPPF